MKMQWHWFLGFLGLVGVAKIATVWGYFQGPGTGRDLLNLLWFAWFLYLIPEGRQAGAD